MSVKIFIRNLQTGSEEYVGDPSHLGELVLRHLHEAEHEAQKAKSGSETGPGEASRTGS